MGKMMDHTVLGPVQTLDFLIGAFEFFMDTGIFDRERFRREYPDQSLMRELIDIFQEETSAYFEQARHAVSQNDATEVHAAAHSLKGTIGSYFAKRACQSATALDAMARRGDLTQAANTLAACEREVEHLQSALLEFRDTLR